MAAQTINHGKGNQMSAGLYCQQQHPLGAVCLTATTTIQWHFEMCLPMLLQCITKMEVVVEIKTSASSIHENLSFQHTHATTGASNDIFLFVSCCQCEPQCTARCQGNQMSAGIYGQQ